jgi:PAS domain S-box-containing protein
MISKSKILLVEDNETSLKLLKAVYEADYDILTAVDGLEALEILFQHHIDLVISDILMPNLDGYHLTYTIRTNPRLKDIPVVIYTATYVSMSEEKIALEMGANLYIRKPAPINILISKVKEILAEPKKYPCIIPTRPEAEEKMSRYSEKLISKLEQSNIVLEEANEKIRKLNADLEHKVMERTAQLEGYIEQLKESEEKFQKAFQASAAGISITKLSDSTFLNVNDTFIQMTEYSKEELIGHTSIELGIVVNPKKRQEALQRIKEQGSTKNFELQVRSKSGKILDVLFSTETILLNNEAHAINIIFDITDRRRAEEQLEVANKELEAFSYSVSHDLKAPLRSIRGYTSIIEQNYAKKFDDEGRRLLNIVCSTAKKMDNLIDDLLAFSKLGKKEIKKVSVDMNELVNEVLIDLKKYSEHNTNVTIHDLHSVWADYMLLRQAVVNLISNGIKYSSKTAAPAIEIGSEKKDKEIVYSVKDNGVGFDMEHVDKLFGAFQRLHGSEEFEGTGLGLAIVQRIINRHGGEIWAEAAPNKGATFSFSLPIVSEQH